MAYTLRLGEMIEAMRATPSLEKDASRFQKVLEAIGSQMAATLAHELGIKHGRITHDCGMVAGPFYPSTKDQKIPEVLLGWDSEDEWEIRQ